MQAVQIKPRRIESAGYLLVAVMSVILAAWASNDADGWYFGSSLTIFTLFVATIHGTLGLVFIVLAMRAFVNNEDQAVPDAAFGAWAGMVVGVLWTIAMLLLGLIGGVR